MDDLIAKIPVQICCPKCQQATLATDDDGDQPQEDSPVYCKFCGERFGPWRDVKAQALHAAGEELKRRLGL